MDNGKECNGRWTFVVTISPLLMTNTFQGLIYILCFSHKGSCIVCVVFDHEVYDYYYDCFGRNIMWQLEGEAFIERLYSRKTLRKMKMYRTFIPHIMPLYNVCFLNKLPILQIYLDIKIELYRSSINCNNSCVVLSKV